MILIRKIFNPQGEGFAISHDPLDPMGLIIGAGKFGDSIVLEETNITFPVIDVERNVLITLQDDPVEPIHMLIARNYTEHPEYVVSQALIILCNIFIPPNCTDLTQIQVFTRRFCDTKEAVTLFDERGQVIWEAN